MRSRMNEWMNGSINEWMNKRKNKGRNEWIGLRGVWAGVHASPYHSQTAGPQVLLFLICPQHSYIDPSIILLYNKSILMVIITFSLLALNPALFGVQTWPDGTNCCLLVYCHCVAKRGEDYSKKPRTDISKPHGWPFLWLLEQYSNMQPLNPSHTFLQAWKPNKVGIILFGFAYFIGSFKYVWLVILSDLFLIKPIFYQFCLHFG